MRNRPEKRPYEASASGLAHLPLLTHSAQDQEPQMKRLKVFQNQNPFERSGNPNLLRPVNSEALAGGGIYLLPQGSQKPDLVPHVTNGEELVLIPNDASTPPEGLSRLLGMSKDSGSMRELLRGPGQPRLMTQYMMGTAETPLAEDRSSGTESGKELDYSKDAAKDLRPPLSYTTLIAQALFSNNKEKLTINNIYQ